MKSLRERTPAIREWADCEEDEGGEDGWSISNGNYHVSAQTPEDGDLGDEVTVSGVMLMRVNGHGPGGL